MAKITIVLKEQEKDAGQSVMVLASATAEEVVARLQKTNLFPNCVGLATKANKAAAPQPIASMDKVKEGQEVYIINATPTATATTTTTTTTTTATTPAATVSPPSKTAAKDKTKQAASSPATPATPATTTPTPATTTTTAPVQQAQKQQATTANDANEPPFDRVGFQNLVTRKFFISPSFEIYGGVAGLYDYGPPGCAVKDNMLQLWKRHFVMEEGMHMLEATSLTPEVVLKASGHCDRFTDFLVKDQTTGDCFRADHLLEETLEKKLAATGADKLSEAEKKEALDDKAQADSFEAGELHARIKRWGVVSPTGGVLSEPYAFNLMFGTLIGPTGTLQGYLRPETAQGIFVNFRKLLEYNGSKIPFACAQIGHAFRNEIAPRAGVLRVREFQQCEIEHFCHPQEKNHPKFPGIRDLVIALYPRENQMSTRELSHMKLGDAVKQKIIDNETLAYFIGRVGLYLIKCGIKPDKLRFRQHLAHEMAHYAQDCWDAEVKMSYGWIEVVGIADRSAYDLKVHTAKSNTELLAYRAYDNPIEVDTVSIEVDKKKLGAQLGQNSGAVFAYLKECQPEDAFRIQQSATTTGEASITLPTGTVVTLKKEDMTFKPAKKKSSGESYTPHVIEPSFGVGRIMYGCLEHAYWVRKESEQRKVLSFTPWIAPVKCIVLPLSSQDALIAMALEIQSMLTSLGLSNKVDDSGSGIGKRYSRNDEIGIPFGITVDFDSLKNRTVTLRERDSTTQVRGTIQDVLAAVQDLCVEKIKWADVWAKFDHVAASATDEK